MKTDDKLYIITPVFNRKKFTRNYLAALEKQTNRDFKIIIVDDGSTDGTSEMIEKEFPDVIILKEKGNLWWAEATNIGVKYAIKLNAKYIMTLNDDTLPRQDYIEKMMYWSSKEPNALLGAFAIDVNSGESLYGGERRDWRTSKDIQLLEIIPKDKQFGLHKVDFFPGRGLLIPIKVFEKIGFYDSRNFPQTVADNDFTYRAARNGFEIYCNYDAKIGIYPDESGGEIIRNRKTIKNYYKHLFGMKGGGNLKWFILFGIKNCPKRYLPRFLITGILKRIFGYFLH